MDSRDALWASDRSRVAVCARVAPLPGVSYDRLREEVFARVEWGDRDLRFHDARRAADAEADAGWVMECTLSCLAHGDEAQVAYRIEGLAAEFVEEADVLVSAPCHVPLLRVTAADLAFDARTGEALAPGRLGFGSGVEIATAADLLRAAGLAVAAEALDTSAVERALLAVNRRIAKAERALSEMHPSVNVGADVFAFREMGSRGGERFDLLFPKGTDRADRASEDASEDADEDADAAFVRELAMNAPWVRTLVEPLLGSNDAADDAADETADDAAEDARVANRREQSRDASTRARVRGASRARETRRVSSLARSRADTRRGMRGDVRRHRTKRRAEGAREPSATCRGARGVSDVRRRRRPHGVRVRRVVAGRARGRREARVLGVFGVADAGGDGGRRRARAAGARRRETAVSRRRNRRARSTESAATRAVVRVKTRGGVRCVRVGY